MNLVVVESPAKAKTINKYLGDDYIVLASYGHIRDLPSKNGSVDPENNFKMEWEVDSFSKKYLKEIQKPDHIGINAFSIAEITGIPRATVVRKLEFLMKNKFLNISEKKLYTFGIGVQSKQFKVISKLQDRNMNALSKFLYRVFNQINVINSN